MSVRIDRWLWAARFFKTRSLAADAVAGGKVHLDGERPKPAKPVHVGDRLRIRVGSYEYHVTIRGLSERRGPSRAAAALYDETPESRTARLRLAEQHRLAPSLRFEGKGRPTKKDRREIGRLKGD